MINKSLYLVLMLAFYPIICQAAKEKNKDSHLPIYVGAMGGYGSTTWQGLVPTDDNLNLAMNMSTPIRSEEGGGVWGFYFGKELFPNFALEASYMHYPNASVFFDPMSLFSFTNNDLTEFTTHTETVNLMVKVMLSIPNSPMRLYSSIGAANVHRNDMLMEGWRLSPTFGAGLSYQMTDYLMSELVGNYTAGFGESQLNPTNSYFPFLYSVTLRLAYCFNL